MLYKTIVAFVATAEAFEMPISKVMQSSATAAAGALVAGSLFAAPAFAADAGAGGQVFDGNCAACHAGGQNVIVSVRRMNTGHRI